MKFTTLPAALLVCAVSVFAADPQLLNMVPPDAKVFAGINVEQAKTSPLGVYLLSQVTMNKELQCLVDATGFDPRRDVRELLVVANTAVPSATAEGIHGMQPEGLFLVKGTFPIAQLVAAATKAGLTATTFANAQLLTGPSGMHGGKGSVALGLIDASTAVAGDEGSVRAALTRRSQNNVVDPVVIVQINQLSGTSDAWSVSTAGFAQMPMFSKKGANSVDMLKAIQQVSMSLKLGTQVVLDANAIADTAANATSVSDVLRFGLQMVGMQGVPSELQSLLKTLVITTDGTMVHVGLSIPENQLETLMKSAHAAHGTGMEI